MDKKQLANVIATQVWSYGGIVYGGWVRDVIILGQDDFRDLNVLFQDSTSVQTFIEFLQSNYTCINDYYLTITQNQIVVRGLTIYSTCVEVNGILKITIDQIDFNDLIEKKYCNLSCNLFYKKGSEHLDAFWIPSNWPSLEELIEYTKSKKFTVVLTPASDDVYYYPLNCRKVIWNTIKKGWQLGARFLTDDIKATIPSDYLDEVIAIENAFAPPSEAAPSQ